jgi:hypothetical protein
LRGKSFYKGFLGKSKRRLENNFKLDLRENNCEDKMDGRWN